MYINETHETHVAYINTFYAVRIITQQWDFFFVFTTLKNKFRKYYITRSQRIKMQIFTNYFFR